MIEVTTIFPRSFALFQNVSAFHYIGQVVIARKLFALKMNVDVNDSVKMPRLILSQAINFLFSAVIQYNILQLD